MILKNFLHKHFESNDVMLLLSSDVVYTAYMRVEKLDIEDCVFLAKYFGTTAAKFFAYIAEAVTDVEA